MGMASSAGVTCNRLGPTSQTPRHVCPLQVTLRMAKVKDGNGACREAILSWAAAATRANTPRLKFGEPREVHNQDLPLLVSDSGDGFLLGLMAVLLRLAKPFVEGWLARYNSAPAASGSPGYADKFKVSFRFIINASNLVGIRVQLWS